MGAHLQQLLVLYSEFYGRRREHTIGLVVSAEAVDTRFDENEAELGVLVLAVALEVLSDGDRLHRVSILWNHQALCLEMRTFRINMYKSSGISGARPADHSLSMIFSNRKEALMHRIVALRSQRSAATCSRCFAVLSSEQLAWESCTVRLEDAEDFVACFIVSRESKACQSSGHTSNDFDLRDAVAISQDDTDLGWSGTLPCELADLLLDLVGCDLQPCWCCAAVRDSGLRNTLSVAVKTTHGGGVVESI